ncbi:MAG: hypothetical protein U5L09_16195 [Bacteroidales bacterium]|nr:hypothetical protein [Bacteroidales bacterium]
MHNLFVFILTAMLLGACSFGESKKNQQESASAETDTTVIDFWNGNRSEIRQDYERQVLKAVLTATATDFGPWKIQESLKEYPGMEESLVFSEKEHHLFVTIAGNQKFTEDDR